MTLPNGSAYFRLKMLSQPDPLDYLSGQPLESYKRAYAQLMGFTCKYGYLTACNIWKKQYSSLSLHRKNYKTIYSRLTHCKQVISELGDRYASLPYWPREILKAYIQLKPESYEPEYRNPKYATALLHLRSLMKAKAKILHERWVTNLGTK
jgi:hypothetical protein